MIVFNGEVSDNAKSYMKKLVGNIIVAVISTVFAICSILIITFCIHYDWIIALFFVPLLYMEIGGLYYRFVSRDLKKVTVPTKVSIMRDMLTSSGKDFEHGRQYDDIKKVIDCGEWYHIIFYFPHKSIYYICQKDLITEGTIEEFEELFKDKLVRKNKNSCDINEKI